MQCTLSVLLGQASVFQFQGNVLSHLITTLFDWLSCPFKLPPLAPLHFMCEWCCKVTWWWASLRIHSYGSFFSFLFLFLFFFSSFFFFFWSLLYFRGCFPSSYLPFQFFKSYTSVWHSRSLPQRGKSVACIFMSLMYFVWFSFHRCVCLFAHSALRPEVTLCHWQDIRI